MLPPNARVVAGVSGGPDSMALLGLLRAEAPRLGAALAVAHLDHALRPRSGEDRDFVERAAAEAGLPFYAERIDVAALAREEHRSIEEAGRAARYRFFARVAKAWDARVVAVGHQRDDRAEGLLMRVIAGSGRAGLAAIRPVVDAPEGHRIVRPLIDIPREDILAWLHESATPFLTDETNDDPAFLRNRVRTLLIPLLEREFNPAVRAALARTAEILREEDELLSGLTLRWLDNHARAPGAGAERPGSTPAPRATHPPRERPPWTLPRRAGTLRIPTGALAELPRAFARRVLREAALRAGASGRLLRFDQIETALGLLERAGREGSPAVTESRRVMLAGGFSIRREGGEIVVGSDEPSHPEGAVALVLPGLTPVRGSSSAIRSELIPREQLAEPLSGGSGPVAHLDYDATGARLLLRHRRRGDRFHPLGAPGSRKLSDVLIDAGIPRSLRDALPVIAAEGAVAGPGGTGPADATSPGSGPRAGCALVDSAIAWVPGVRIAQPCRVTEGTRTILRLELVDGRGGPA